MKKSKSLLIWILLLVMIVAPACNGKKAPAVELSQTETKAETHTETQAETQGSTDHMDNTVTYYKVMSYNIAGYDDTTAQHRADVVTVIMDIYPDLMLLNEASPLLYTENESISSIYGMVDPYFRDNGNEAYSSIMLYRKDLFELTYCKTYCLTDTTTRYSKVTDSYHYRFATFAYFKELATQKSFVVIGTHLENNSTNTEIYARRNNARVLQAGHLLDLMESELYEEDMVMLLGDLNSIREGGNAALVRFGGVNELLNSGKLVDSSDIAQTASNFPSHVAGITFDYILLKPNCFDVEKYMVQAALPITSPSDHYPVVVHLTFSK